MFCGSLGLLIQYQNLKKDSTFDMTGFDFTNVESLKSIYAVNLGVNVIFDENFDTSNVKDFSAMFELSYLVEPLDYRIFDLSSAEYIAGFFSIYQGDELDVSDFKLNSITNISSLFSGFDGKIIGLDKWDVSKVTNFNSLFNYYAYFDSVDISNWDLSSAESTYSMFRLLYNIDILDLSTLNFGNSKDYRYMFMEGNDPYPSIIDISGSDWNEDALVDGMFLNHEGTTIYVKDEKAKVFIEKQAPDCIVLVKE